MKILCEIGLPTGINANRVLERVRNLGYVIEEIQELKEIVVEEVEVKEKRKETHNLYTGKDCSCVDDGGICWICRNITEGGLAACKTCGGAEGSLTTDCCGRQLTEYEENHIYHYEDLDFKNGEWIKINPRDLDSSCGE